MTKAKLKRKVIRSVMDELRSISMVRGYPTPGEVEAGLMRVYSAGVRRGRRMAK